MTQQIPGPTPSQLSLAGNAYYSKATAAFPLVDGSATYDFADLAIPNVPPGTYYCWISAVCSTKNGSFRFILADSLNNQLWPLNYTVTSWTNADGYLQAFAIFMVTLAASTSVKVRAAASAAIGNYTVYDRSLGMVKVAAS